MLKFKKWSGPNRTSRTARPAPVCEGGGSWSIATQERLWHMDIIRECWRRGRGIVVNTCKANKENVRVT